MPNKRRRRRPNPTRTVARLKHAHLLTNYSLFLLQELKHTYIIWSFHSSVHSSSIQRPFWLVPENELVSATPKPLPGRHSLTANLIPSVKVVHYVHMNHIICNMYESYLESISTVDTRTKEHFMGWCALWHHTGGIHPCALAKPFQFVSSQPKTNWNWELEIGNIFVK